MRALNLTAWDEETIINKVETIQVSPGREIKVTLTSGPTRRFAYAKGVVTNAQSHHYPRKPITTHSARVYLEGNEASRWIRAGVY